MIVVCFEVDDVIWCDFMVLCDGLCSQNDYIELVWIYYVVVVFGVLVMGVVQDDMVCRFVNMVDEFYDCNVKLIMFGVVLIDVLYSGGCLDFEFQCIWSWFLEMQSVEYLLCFYKF